MATWTGTITTSAADTYTDWVEAECRGSYSVTFTWLTTQNPPVDIIIESKAIDAADAARVTSTTLVGSSGVLTGMRSDTFSGNRLWRVGIPSGESVSSAHTLTIQV